MCHCRIAALVLLAAALTAALPIDSVSQDLSTTSPSTTDALKVSLSSSKETISSSHSWPVMEDPDLFEGDLKISQEMIDKYYGKKNKTRSMRSAARSKNLLWSSGRIYYQYHSSVSSGLQTNIRAAMDTIQRQTCLRFTQRSSQSDYVKFTSHSTDGCFSDSIGRKGGRQIITLGPGCNNKGIILHEICHSLGLWHEQSRPDRDYYVRILQNNIQTNKTHNFKRRSAFEVDYQGTTYDYGSVMHYQRNAFVLPNASVTIEVNNDTEYIRQGSPTLGSHTKTQLSNTDATQLKRMYNCPGSGVAGILKVYIRNGVGLPDKDILFGYSDPYVKVTAVDDSGSSVTYSTRHIQEDHSPSWNQWLDFGGRISWQYFEMSVWDRDIFFDDRMLNTQSFSINPGYHRNLQHCGRDTCSARVNFDYNLILDGNECSPSPCIRGTCTDRISSYQCNCPSGYSGTNCEHIQERLRIYARYGSGLPDRDGWLGGNSDPYVRVIAYDHEGNYKSLRTSVDYGDHSPEWYQWLDFGTDTWKRFTVQVFDEDFLISDDSLSSVSTYSLNYLISRTNVRKNCNSGYIYFDYEFVRQ